MASNINWKMSSTLSPHPGRKVWGVCNLITSMSNNNEEAMQALQDVAALCIAFLVDQAVHLTGRPVHSGCGQKHTDVFITIHKQQKYIVGQTFAMTTTSS